MIDGGTAKNNVVPFAAINEVVTESSGKVIVAYAADQNVIFFYDTRGERYLKVNLQQRFTLPTVLAEAG